MTATKRQYVNETRIVDERDTMLAGLLQNQYVVRAYSIISTDLVAFEVDVVAEPTAAFSSFFHHEEYGRLAKFTSARPVDRILALPYGDERTRLVTEHYEALHKREREVIEAAFPGLTLSPAGLSTIDEFRAAVQS